MKIALLGAFPLRLARAVAATYCMDGKILNEYYK